MASPHKDTPLLPLGALFNRAARPLIMLYANATASEPRGDLHGYRGIGRHLARILDGDFVELGAADLDLVAPRELASLQLQKYFDKHPMPDILLSREMPIMQVLLEKKMRDIPVRISTINEHLPGKYLPTRKTRWQVVPHHLTADFLGSEGKTFRQTYRDITGDLVGYMMIEATDGDIAHSAKLMIAKALQHKTSLTFFICGCRRTAQGQPAKLAALLQEYAESKGIADRVSVLSYDYKAAVAAGEAYNPYAGLLSQADHLVVEDGSVSVMSEALFTGKTVHMADYNYYFDGLSQKGHIVQPSYTSPFITTTHQPVDTTEDIAKAIARQYRRRTAFGL